MIAQATLPESGFDRNRVRDSLAALRLGHDGLEQFVGLLFDELDSLREDLDEERFRLDEDRHRLREAEAQIAAERSQWETDRQHWHDALQKRVVELERDRLAITSELDSERRRSSEMAQAAADQQRQFTAERSELAAELRHLGTLLDAKKGVAGQTPVSSVEPGSRVSAEAPDDGVHALATTANGDLRNAKAESHPATVSHAVAQPSAKSTINHLLHVDPVMGPLLSQFQLLQKDVARRREKKH